MNALKKLKTVGKWLILTLSPLLLPAFEAPYESTVVHDRSYYEQRGDVMWEVPIEEKLIALTFDDGPSFDLTPQILDVLKQYDAKATFFVLGNRIDRHKDIVLREVMEGHEIGNHTFNHAFFNHHLSKNRISREIETTKRKLKEVAGVDSPWFRPPGGYYNDSVIEAAKESGYTVILWSWHQDTEDWKSPGVEAIVNKVLNNVRNGDIVLMHDNVMHSHQTVDALKIILPELKARGYKFVTISELVEQKYRWDELDYFQYE